MSPGDCTEKQVEGQPAVSTWRAKVEPHRERVSCWWITPGVWSRSGTASERACAYPGAWRRSPGFGDRLPPPLDHIDPGRRDGNALLHQERNLGPTRIPRQGYPAPRIHHPVPRHGASGGQGVQSISDESCALGNAEELRDLAVRGDRSARDASHDRPDVRVCEVCARLHRGEVFACLPL